MRVLGRVWIGGSCAVALVLGVGVVSPVAAVSVDVAQCAAVVQTSHRGLGADENTVAAFQRAVDAGMTAVETDLRMTRDGQFVLMHDSSVRRTTNGRGRVSSMTAARFRLLRTRHGEHPPVLAEAIATLARDAAPPELQLELKQRVTGKPLRRLAALLSGYGVPRVVVTSPRISQLVLVQRAVPGIRTGLIDYGRRGRPEPRRVAAAGIDYVMVSRSAASAGYVAKARAHGVRVSARFTDLPLAARLGIARVLTDRPLSC